MERVQPTDGVDTALARLLHQEQTVGLGALRACLEELRQRRAAEGDVSLAALLVERQLIGSDALEGALSRLDAGASEGGSSRGGAVAVQATRFGPYLLLGELARGGMGAVYEAVHEATSVRYALKTLLPELLGQESSEDVLRFRREAEVLAQLDHPHVARIHAADLDGPTPYLVQDLLPGGTLLDRIRELSVEEAARIVAQVARGVQYCHEHGVLHRDLKPENVLFDDRGEPRLVDFGIAYVQSAQGLTQTGAVMGTPGYMAPEQALGLRTGFDARTDVYGLGAILYASLTGGPPFAGGNLMAILDRVTHEAPAPPSRVRSGVPKWLEAVCLKALAKRPQDRFETAGALADSLEQGPVSRSGSRRSLPLWAACLALVLSGILVAALGSRVGPTVDSQSALSPTPSAAEPEPVAPTPTEDFGPRTLGVRPEAVFEHQTRHVPKRKGAFTFPMGAATYEVDGAQWVLTWGVIHEARRWRVDKPTVSQQGFQLTTIPRALVVVPGVHSFYVAYPVREYLERRSLSSGELEQRFRLPPSSEVNDMALSTDGKRIALAIRRIRGGVGDSLLGVIDVEVNNFTILRCVQGYVTSVALSPQRFVAVTAVEDESAKAAVFSWSVPLSDDLGTAPDWSCELKWSGRHVALSYDGNYLAVATKMRQILVFDGEQPPVQLRGKHQSRIAGAHSTPVRGLGFCGSPLTLVSASGNPANSTEGAELAHWDLQNPKQPVELSRVSLPHAAADLLVAPSGNVLLVPMRDGNVGLWRLGSRRQ